MTNINIAHSVILRCASNAMKIHIKKELAAYAGRRKRMIKTKKQPIEKKVIEIFPLTVDIRSLN